MESFSLLKYWRGGGATAGRPTMISSSVLSPAVSFSDSDDDGGSFFDLELAVPDESLPELLHSDALSPSTDLFFKESSIVVSSDQDSKPISQLPVSLLKSATKMRVFLLGLAKSRSGSADVSSPVSTISSPKPKFLIVSLFNRDANGAKQARSSKEEADEKKVAKEVVLKYLNKIRPLYVRVSKRYGDKLRFSTGDGDETDAEPDVAVVKPPVAPPAVAAVAAPSPAKKSDVSDSDANHPVVVACGVRAPRASMPAGIKQVYKRLGKSRSASAMAGAPAKAAEPAAKRRDDSLLQQEDGIQSAIAHCKRSFNSPSGSESPLQRSMSDPGDGRLDEPVEEASV